MRAGRVLPTTTPSRHTIEFGTHEGKTKTRNQAHKVTEGPPEPPFRPEEERCLTVAPVVSCPDMAPKIEPIGRAGALEMCMHKKSFYDFLDCRLALELAPETLLGSPFSFRRHLRNSQSSSQNHSEFSPPGPAFLCDNNKSICSKFAQRRGGGIDMDMANASFSIAMVNFAFSLHATS